MEVIDSTITAVNDQTKPIEIKLNKDIDHDVLLMNDKTKEKIINNNTFNDDNNIQLITYSKLTPNTGININEDDSVYQITQIKNKYFHNDTPITIFGGRKVIHRLDDDLLSNYVKNFKSSGLGDIQWPCLFAVKTDQLTSYYEQFADRAYQ